MEGLWLPYRSSGYTAPVGGMGGAAGRARVGWFGCLRMLGGGGGDLVLVIKIRQSFPHEVHEVLPAPPPPPQY